MNTAKQILSELTWKRVRVLGLVLASVVWLAPPIIRAIDAVITIAFRGVVIIGVALVTRYYKEILNWIKTSGKEAMKEVF